MKQETKLSRLQENHDSILDSFGCDKERVNQALDDLFGAWLSNPFEIDYSKDERQNYFEFYVALKKQIELMEYNPTITEKLREIKSEQVKEKYSSLKIDAPGNDCENRKN